MTLIAYCWGYLAAGAGAPRFCNPYIAGPFRIAWGIGHYDAIDDLKERSPLPKLEPEVADRELR